MKKGRTKLLLLTTAFLLSSAIAGFTQTPTPPPLKPYILRWNANAASQNIIFYNVYTKTLAGTYLYTATVTPIIPPPAQIDWTVPTGTPGGTTFAVTASNGHVESDRSADATSPIITAPGGTMIVEVETGGMINISTRAEVSSGDNVMIAGFILADSQEVAIRAIGPSLAKFGLDALSETSVELHDSGGAQIAANNGWETGSDADELRAHNLAPESDKESALIQSLGAGAYTAIVRGAPADTGIGLVEVYQLSMP